MRFYVLLVSIAANSAVAADRCMLPNGFVYLDESIPDLVVELRYASDDNFVGRPVDGYGQHARGFGFELPPAEAILTACIGPGRAGFGSG